MGVEEYAIEEEVKSYYEEFKGVFAAQNAGALTELFDSGISKPMTLPQIRAWAEKFFSENKGVDFHVERIEFLGIGLEKADIRLTYHVTTVGGKGDFGGVELDTLVKRGGKWRISAWEKDEPSRR